MAKIKKFPKEKSCMDNKISDILPVEIFKLLEPFDFKSIYDLGNKVNKVNKVNKGIPYRLFYNNKNIIYDSIDLNGLDGSLKYDLEKSINLENREMVANIGTSEHIKNQKQVFKNMHNLSNYRIVHWVPLSKKRLKHGCYGYTKIFFKMLAELNNYKIQKLYIYEPRHIVCCSYRKIGNDKFIWDDKLINFIEYKEHGRCGVQLRGGL